MKKHTTPALALASILAALAARPALADHNSPMGAGWANMPNDIHNTRVDTRLADDEEEEFMEFVQYGAGADTVNRFLTDTTATSTSTSKGSASSPSR